MTPTPDNTKGAWESIPQKEKEKIIKKCAKEANESQRKLMEEVAKMKTKKWSDRFRKDFMTKKFFPIIGTTMDKQACNYFVDFIQELLDSQRAELLERLPKEIDINKPPYSNLKKLNNWKEILPYLAIGFNDALSEVRDLLTKEEK